MHFETGDEGVPMRNRTPTGPRVKVHPAEPKGGWNQGSSRNVRSSGCAIGDLGRVEGFAVEDQLGVELSGTPTVEDRPHVILRYSRLSETQEVDERAQLRRQRDNRADIQVAVSPAVHAVAHATGAGIR